MAKKKGEYKRVIYLALNTNRVTIAIINKT
jgi:hypothetical protein